MVMEKPTRIDNDKIVWGGEFARKQYHLAETGHTSTEDHGTGDWWFRLTPNGRKWYVEQKTVRCCFLTADKLYPSRNRSWDLDSMEFVPTGRTWMLNYTNADGSPGKFQTMDGVCLQYIFKDGVLMFSPEELGEAYLGTAFYTCSQRQEFERSRRRRTPQLKAMINLEKGVWVPCTPPDWVFESKPHEDFNKLNDICR